MPSENIPLFGILILIGIQAVLCAPATEVRLTQESPCFAEQPCLLKCSLVSGQNQGGLLFFSLAGQVVTCSGKDSCTSTISTWYNLTVVSDSVSTLQIRKFSRGRDQGDWTCREDSKSSTNSTIYVQENVSPAGPTFGSSCVTGRVTSPSFLTCSLATLGVPPATVILKDSSSQTVSSSQHGSVLGTVTRGGQASCSVTWSAFPSFQLNVIPAQCTVQVFPSVTAVGALRVTVKEGQSVTFTCDAKGYPKPEIKWSPLGSSATVDVDDTETRDSLTLTPDRSGGVSQSVTCTASNPAGSAVVSFSLSLQYLPYGPPVISGLPPDGVTIGDDVILSCSVSGGNPPVSNVTLTCPRHSNTSQGVVSSLEFTAGRKDQGSCVCSAFHVLGYSLTASLNINVQEEGNKIAMPVAVTFVVTLITTTLFTWFVTMSCCKGRCLNKK